MNSDIAIINRHRMILSNFMRIGYVCDRRIDELTLCDIEKVD
jgi:hypothetical protein